jgi:hypothetical protein
MVSPLTKRITNFLWIRQSSHLRPRTHSQRLPAGSFREAVPPPSDELSDNTGLGDRVWSRPTRVRRTSLRTAPRPLADRMAPSLRSCFAHSPAFDHQERLHRAGPPGREPGRQRRGRRERNRLPHVRHPCRRDGDQEEGECSRQTHENARAVLTVVKSGPVHESLPWEGRRCAAEQNEGRFHDCTKSEFVSVQYREFTLSKTLLLILLLESPFFQDSVPPFSYLSGLRARVPTNFLLVRCAPSCRSAPMW